MFAVPDALAGFYLASFFIGLAVIVISAAMGLTHDVTHLPGLDHGDAGSGADFGHGHADAAGMDVGHGHADAGTAHAGNGPHGDAAHAGGSSHTVHHASPLNLMTIMAFLTWFGGIGYILHTLYGVLVPISLAAGGIAGVLAGWLVNLFLVRVLLPGTAGSDARDVQVVGNLAQVTIEIRAGGLGEVVYTMGGSRHSDGARSVDGKAIPRGTEVVIVRYEKGIAFVEPWSRFVESGAAKDERQS